MWLRPIFCFDSFANILLCFHWPECSVPLKCPRQEISRSSICALAIPGWCGLFRIMSIYCRLCIISPVLIVSVHSANVFWLTSAPFLLHSQVNPGTYRPESLIFSPLGWGHCLCFSDLLGDVAPSLLEFPIFFDSRRFDTCLLLSDENQIVSPD